MDNSFITYSDSPPGPLSILANRLAEKNADVMKEKTVHERREIMDNIADIRVISPWADIEDRTCNGVPCRIICPKNAVDSGEIILYVHGGSWAWGNLGTCKAFGVYLSEVTGCRVLIAEYRLIPEHPYPAGLDDVFSVYLWLLENGYDSLSITLFGDSAGGNLCLALLLRLKSLGYAQPLCCCLASPVTDVRESSAVATSKDDMIYCIHDGAAVDIFTMYAYGYDRSDPMLSPVTGELSGLCPMLIHSGEDEPITDDNIAFTHKARLQGTDASLKIWRRMFHDFSIVGRALKESRESISEFAEFINAHIKNRGVRKMIRHSGQGRVEKRTIADGSGEIILRHIFEKDDMFGKSRLCAELTVEPGCSIGRHAHDGEIEIFYMLEGELVSVDGGVEEPFIKGDSMLTGGGSFHCLRNDSGEKAVMLAFIAV